MTFLRAQPVENKFQAPEEGDKPADAQSMRIQSVSHVFFALAALCCLSGASENFLGLFLWGNT